MRSSAGKRNACAGQLDHFCAANRGLLVWDFHLYEDDGARRIAGQAFLCDVRLRQLPGATDGVIPPRLLLRWRFRAILEMPGARNHNFRCSVFAPFSLQNMAAELLLGSYCWVV
jgi:hypothetical protein